MFRDAFFAFARGAGPDCRLRFAPTPSGYIHVGNALNFTLNWLVARLHGGKIVLRIDDLDADRKRPEYVADIFESLHWLGLDWDEGPGLIAGLDPVQDFEENWSQHKRLLLYHNLLDALRAQNMLFACRKSRSELAAYNGQYPEAFRHQNLSLDDTNVAWRIRTEADSGLNDFVLRRRDGIPAYQIASLADDDYFNITHVIRGADLEPSTAAQQFLAKHLNMDKFLHINFLHHPLLLGESGEKLSKSAGSTSLKAIRETGDKGQVFRQISGMLGVRAESAAELLLRLLAIDR